MCMELGAEAFIDFKTCEDVTAEVSFIAESVFFFHRARLSPRRASSSCRLLFKSQLAHCAFDSLQALRITGGGGHAVICTGGTAGAYKSAPTFLRKGGTMVAIGLPAAGTAIAGVDPLAMIFNKLTIKGSLTGNMADVDEALDFVRRGIVKPVVTVIPFSQFKEGLAQLVSSI